jgi:hypothetical protein
MKWNPNHTCGNSHPQQSARKKQIKAHIFVSLVLMQENLAIDSIGVPCKASIIGCSG